jgi:hypothetical protein
MSEPMVLVRGFGGDVHVAAIAGWRFLITTVAVERPAEEELFEPAAVLVVQLSGVARQVQTVAARIAVARAELL